MHYFLFRGNDLVQAALIQHHAGEAYFTMIVKVGSLKENTEVNILAAFILELYI